MKMLSTLALAAALAAGLGAVTAAPATAAKKEDAKPGMKLSPEFVKVAKPAQDALAAKTYDTAEPLVAQSEAAAKTDDEKYVAAQLRFDLVRGRIVAAQNAGSKSLDETALAGPLDTLLASPVTPQANKAQYAFVRGSIAFNGKQPAQAIQYLTQARDLGYTDPNLGLMLAQAKMDSGDLAAGTAEMDKAIAAAQASGKPAPDNYYKYAITRSLRAKDKPATVSWLNKYVKAYPTPQVWHDTLITYGFSTPSVDVLDKGQRIDLYRLMHDSKALSDQASYEEYAQDATDRGLSNEAAVVLKEGLASGKLTANRNLTEALNSATAKTRAEGSLSTLEARSRTAADGKLASQTADAYLSRGDNAKAADLYKVALSKGGVNADEVNTHLGIALARSGDKAGATAAFGMVKGGVRGNIAAFWTTFVSQG